MVRAGIEFENRCSPHAAKAETGRHCRSLQGFNSAAEERKGPTAARERLRGEVTLLEDISAMHAEAV